MQKAGYNVMVIAMEPDGTMAHDMRAKGITVADLNITGIKTLWKGYRKFKEIVKQFAPGIIHSHMIHANLFARVFKVFNPNYKLISTAHNIKEGGKIMMWGYT